MKKKTYYKRDLILKEETQQKTIALQGDSSTLSNAMSKVNSTTPSNNPVELDSSNFNTSAQKEKVQFELPKNASPEQIKKTEDATKTVQQHGGDSEVIVTPQQQNSSYKRSGSLVEGVTFTKKELSDFLRSI